MTHDVMDATWRIALTSPTTELLLLAEDGLLPQVVHWGRPVAVADAAVFDAMAAAVTTHPMHNGIPDEGYRLAVLPEQWSGWTGRPGLVGSRQGRDWAPRFVVETVSVDGQAASGDLAVADATTTPSTVVVEATDADTALSLCLDLEMQPSGLVRARAEVTNTGGEPYQLEGLTLALPVPPRATELLDLHGRWGKERVPQRMPMRTGAHVREGRHGRTGHDAATVVHLGEQGFDFAEGEVWGVHPAWSGNTLAYAEKVLTGEQVLGGGELLLPGEVVLGTGEAYTSPWLVFGHGTGLDELAAQHHELVRSRAPRLDAERPVTLNVWEAVYFDHDTDRLIDLAHRAADLGIERFVLDDGWFGARRNDHAGLGDWVVSPDAWPHGLHPLVDAVAGLGMQFGLWFEPEMVNPDSDLARQHPDWVLQVPGRMPLTERHQWVLDLSNPGAYAHVRDQMAAILDEYPIGYIKWDCNRDQLDAGGADGRPAAHANTAAFYRLVDELKAGHPGLEIESCASGGGRVDLQVVEHCDRVWVSDNIDPTDRQQMMRWTAQLLPPEYLGSHVASGASHTTGRQHTLDHRAATAVFGHLGVEWDLARASDEELGQLRQWIDWYRTHRATLNGGRLVRVDLPQAPSAHLHGVVTPDRAIFGYTLLETAPVWSIGTLPLPGLDPDARWRVEILPLTRSALGHAGDAWCPVELTGRQLAVAGVRAPDVLPERTCILVVERA